MGQTQLGWYFHDHMTGSLRHRLPLSDFLKAFKREGNTLLLHELIVGIEAYAFQLHINFVWLVGAKFLQG